MQPDLVDAHSGLLFAMSVDPAFTPAERLAEARRYGAAVAARARAFASWPAASAIDPGRPLRVGLVSGDLRSHPVGYFVESVIAHLDPARVELFAYPTLPQEDELTARIKPRFAAWHSIVDVGDEAAAARIRADGIQVLVELAGHTAHNRLPVLAWKPAPVQATWLGFFGTTGVPGIDFLLADRVSVPESHRDAFTESVWYLPDTRFCFTPPGDAPAVARAPALRNGFVTFGSFQGVVKLTDAVLAAWAGVLGALPSARLRLQNAQMDFPAARARLLDRLQRAGIDPSRVTTVGQLPRDEYLRGHAEVDLILDTFPYSGATTTCEALWMGVPTLTLAGDDFAARQGASLNACVGLDGWIAPGHGGLRRACGGSCRRRRSARPAARGPARADANLPALRRPALRARPRRGAARNVERARSEVARVAQRATRVSACDPGEEPHEAFGARLRDATLGDEPGHEARRRDVERVVDGVASRRRDADLRRVTVLVAAGDREDLLRLAGLDGDRGPGVERGIERGRRQRDVERHAVVGGGERLVVGADLVADVAVAGDAVGADDDDVDVARAASAARSRRRRTACTRCRAGAAPRPSGWRPAAAGGFR